MNMKSLIIYIIIGVVVGVIFGVVSHIYFEFSPAVVAAITGATVAVVIFGTTKSKNKEDDK